MANRAPLRSDLDSQIRTDPPDRDHLLSVGPADVAAATELSYRRNVFVPLTTACRYTCSYCTFYDPPGQADLLSPREICEIVRRGADAGCTEALFTFGDDPDERYTAIHDQLAEWGHESIHSYLREACEIALDEGLLPHADPGDQTREQMAKVADVTASMGTMLETTADVPAHGGPRGKGPAERLATIRTAGELGVPFTTGILVGVGEDWRDRAESLLAIRALHERYGHVQTVTVQPVVENGRWRDGEPSIQTLRRTVAMARACLPGDVSVRVPSALAPVHELVDCGVDDLGCVAPVSEDLVNPEYEWPGLSKMRDVAADAGATLTERLPIHERYLPASVGGDAPDRRWLSDCLEEELTADTEAGARYRAVLSEN